LLWSLADGPVGRVETGEKPELWKLRPFFNDDSGKRKNWKKLRASNPVRKRKGAPEPEPEVVKKKSLLRDWRPFLARSERRTSLDDGGKLWVECGS